VCVCTTAQELDKYEQQHIDFWDAMATVAGHELEEAQRQEDIDRARARSFRQTLQHSHSSFSVTHCVVGLVCRVCFSVSHLYNLIS
jgi:hypothetical protein